MKVFMFKPRFAPLVKDGTKRQTIRPERKHRVFRGDVLSLREWSGKPYRSKQTVLKETQCESVHSLTIVPRSTPDGMFVSCFVDDQRVESCAGGTGSWDRLAVADGFRNAADMLSWFTETHGLPFNGILVKW